MAADEQTIRMLCWEGYGAAAMTGPYCEREGIEIRVQTLLSDAAAAQSLLQNDLVNWDILNINNAYIRDYLHPRGVIKPLDDGLIGDYRHSIHAVYEDLLPWSFDREGKLIGLGQRFGPFNLVVNTDLISRASAEDQGFELANDPVNQGRFGILDYPDFNVFHCCIGANLNPFDELEPMDLIQFETTAQRWFGATKIVTDDHHRLNRALIDGEIDFYISGGTYTASPARLVGHFEIEAITPRRGPIDGKGGIVFTEITSLLDHPNANPKADSFLRYLLEPDPAATIAFIEGTCNPVAQMGDPRVFKAFDRNQLNAIQWDDLEADLARCAPYQIPPQNDILLSILESTKINCEQK